MWLQREQIDEMITQTVVSNPGC